MLEHLVAAYEVERSVPVRRKRAAVTGLRLDVLVPGDVRPRLRHHLRRHVDAVDIVEDEGQEPQDPAKATADLEEYDAALEGVTG